MAGFLVRCLVSAVGLWLASLIIDGIAVQGVGVLLAAALLLGVTNALVRPVMIILTLPFTILTLGLFLFVINAMMLGLVAWLLDGFALSGFWAALGGSQRVRCALSRLVEKVSLSTVLATLFMPPSRNAPTCLHRSRAGRSWTDAKCNARCIGPGLTLSVVKFWSGRIFRPGYSC